MKKYCNFLLFILLSLVFASFVSSCGTLGSARSLSVDSVYIHNLQYNYSLDANIQSPLQ